MAEGALALAPGGVGALVIGGWIAAAVWAVVRGWRAHLQQRQLRSWNNGVAALLSTAPAIYVVLGAGGQILASSGLHRLFGGPVARMDDLLAQLVGDDAALLGSDIETLCVSGVAFDRFIQSLSGDRILLVHGVAAPRDLQATGVLWIGDATRRSSEAQALRREVERRGQALAALSTMIEAAPFPMWLRHPDRRLALVNGAYARAVEAVGADEVVTRQLELLEGDEGRDRAARVLARGDALTTVEPVIVGGARRMLRLVDVPLGEAGIAGFAFDVEELEELRGELVRLERAQHATFDRLSAAIAMFGGDRTLTFFNTPFVRLFGFDAEWLAEQPEFDRVLERMRENQRLPESRDFPNWRRERRAWFNAAVEVVEESWSLPGGEHLRVLAQPQPEGGLLLVVEDRTEHMRLASARDTLLRVQAATLDNLFEAVAVFAANGRLTLWNSRFARLWNIEPAQLTSPPHVEELVAAASGMMLEPERADLLRDYVRSATTDRRQRSGRIALANGRHLEFAAVPLPDGNALFTFLDITDSRRIEAALRERNEALEAADQVKSAFVANMSYELRTPLTSISGFAEMLQGGYAGPLSEQQRSYLDPIIIAAGRLQTLIDDILDLSASEAGGMSLAVEEVDVAAIAREAVEAVRSAAATRRLELTLNMRDGAGFLEGDRRRLKQSLGNLLSNALAFTPGGGKIMVIADGDDEEARLIVSDSGIGIPPEEQARVFDTFHRIGAGGERKVSLGLPLVRRFVTLHGGRVELISAVGQGTIVTMHLPRSRRALAAQ